MAVLSEPANVGTQPGSPLISLFSAGTSNAPTVTAASWLAGSVNFTVNAVPADLVVGSYFAISGANPTAYNGIFQVTAINGLIISAALVPNPGTYVSGAVMATSALPNPLQSDALGNFSFYALPGTYTVQIYDPLGRLPSQLVLLDQGIIIGGSGSGSVTSVGLAMPADQFTVTGSPVNSSGTLTATKANQTQNTFYAAPSGAGGPNSNRAIVAADLPAGTGTVTSVALAATVPAALLSVAVSGTPITTSGTITVTTTLQNQLANTVFAGATSGGSSQPAFRTLTPADMAAGGLAGLQVAVVTLSSAQLLALLGTPVTLVAAPGVGFAIMPTSIAIAFFGGSAAYTDAGGAVSISAGTLSQALASNAIFLTTTTPNKNIQVIGNFSATATAGNPPTCDNAPLQISKVTNNFAAGNGTAKVTVYYLVQPTT